MSLMLSNVAKLAIVNVSIVIYSVCCCYGNVVMVIVTMIIVAMKMCMSVLSNCCNGDICDVAIVWIKWFDGFVKSIS